MVQVGGLPKDASEASTLSLKRPFTYADAINAGYTRGQIRYLVRTARWLVLRRGIYCDIALSEQANPVWLYATAALLVMTAGAATSHETAGTLYELPVGWRRADPPVTAIQPPMIYLTYPPTSRHSRRGQPGIIERVAALPPSHLVHFQGLLTTTAARTVVDLARLRPYAEGVAIADAAVHLGITTKAQLVAVRDACRSWPGINRATEVIDFADGATESPLESRSRVAFALGGLPTPTLQAVILLRNGRSRTGRLPVGAVAGHWRGRRSPEDPASRGPLGGETPGGRAARTWLRGCPVDVGRDRQPPGDRRRPHLARRRTCPTPRIDRNAGRHVHCGLRRAGRTRSGFG